VNRELHQPQNLPQGHPGGWRRGRGRRGRAHEAHPCPGRRLAGRCLRSQEHPKAISIKAPLQAENGAVVPITVSTSLPNVEAIAILVKENVQPLVASVALTGAGGFFSARMKMGKTSDVKVAVKSGGKLHVATQQIKVTVGGCGG